MDDRHDLKGDTKRMRNEKGHGISIDSRKKMIISGVLNVESFNELEVVLDTELGMLNIKGSVLHVSKLNIETGEVSIDGSIDSCIYSEKQDLKKKGAGFLSKLFK